MTWALILPTGNNLDNPTNLSMPANHGFQLTPDDIEIVRLISELRFAHIDQVSALTNRSHKALARRLLKLQTERYLACIIRRPHRHLYVVGSEGVSLLIEQGHLPQELAARRLRHRELSEISIRHSLFTVDIHARILVLTRNSPVRLVNWEEGPRLWDQVQTRDAEGRGVMIPVRPDAWFTLRHTERPEGKNRLHFFLEADRATMAHSRMENKIRGYLAYYQQGMHCRKYPGMKSFHALTVTTTRERASSLAAHLHPIIPPVSRRLYPFVSFEDLTLDVLLPVLNSQANSGRTVTI